MQILIISHLFPSEIRPSNGTFVFQQVKTLQDKEHNVEVICPIPWIPRWFRTNNQRWKEYSLLPSKSIYKNIPVHYFRGLSLPHKIFLHLRAKMYVATLALKINSFMRKKRFDIIHVHTIIPDAGIAIYIRKKYAIPVVLTIHGADIQIFMKENEKNRKEIFSLLEKTDKIAVVSDKLKKELLEAGLSNKKVYSIHVIPNGIQVYDMYPPKRWPETSRGIRLLTIATLIEQKGFYSIFEVLSDLSDKYNINYCIIGQGRDEQKIKETAHKKGLSEIVHFLGPMPHLEAMAFMKEADIFIMPSKNESFGIVYIEAMYFEKVVIGSKNEGIDGIIVDGRNGFLVNPDNPDELKRKLIYILNHPEKMLQIRKQARQDVWPGFSWSNNVTKYISIYNQCIKEFSCQRG